MMENLNWNDVVKFVVGITAGVSRFIHPYFKSRSIAKESDHHLKVESVVINVITVNNFNETNIDKK